MSKKRRPTRDVACTGKEPLDAERAKQIAARMRRRNARADAYRCTFCGSWHVGTHLTPAIGRRPKARPEEDTCES